MENSFGRRAAVGSLGALKDAGLVHILTAQAQSLDEKSKTISACAANIFGKLREALSDFLNLEWLWKRTIPLLRTLNCEAFTVAVYEFLYSAINSKSHTK